MKVKVTKTKTKRTSRLRSKTVAIPLVIAVIAISTLAVPVLYFRATGAPIWQPDIHYGDLYVSDTYVQISSSGIKVTQSDTSGPPADSAYVDTSPPVTVVSAPVAASSQASVTVAFNGSSSTYLAESPSIAQLITETINSNPYQVTDPGGYSDEYREEMSELKSSGQVLIDIPAIRSDTAEILKEKYGPNLENYPCEDGRTQLLDAIERGQNVGLSLAGWWLSNVVWVIR